jgi:hypothetical protein
MLPEKKSTRKYWKHQEEEGETTEEDGSGYGVLLFLLCALLGLIA